MSHKGFVSLSHRGLIKVEGVDACHFLQNIITHDVHLLKNKHHIHACLLSPQGKFLHDFYVTCPTENTYLLECEGGERALDLAKRLTLYRLRASVTIDIVETDTSVYLMAPFENGDRFLEKPAEAEMPFSLWDTWRIENAIPDGSRDAVIDTSTLAELNLDQSTVSYTKGCYIGQELVARMHNRNLVKRHLVPIFFTHTPPAFGEFVLMGTETIGEMRSKCDKIGLVLIKKDQIDLLPKNDAGFYYL